MKINQIKVGAVLSYLSMGLSTVISLVYTPIMISRLGDSEYGLIADPDDNGLHRALRRMLTEPGLREHYAAMSARRGHDLRGAELARKTEAFFTELLEGTSL